MATTIQRAITQIREADDTNFTLNATTDGYNITYDDASGLFIMASGGGGSPVGNVDEIQLNAGASFGAVTGFLYSGTNFQLPSGTTIRPTSDSTSAITFQNAAGTSDILALNTTNNKIKTDIIDLSNVQSWDGVTYPPDAGVEFFSNTSDRFWTGITAQPNAGGLNIFYRCREGGGGGSHSFYSGDQLSFSANDTQITFGPNVNNITNDRFTANETWDGTTYPITSGFQFTTGSVASVAAGIAFSNNQIAYQGNSQGGGSYRHYFLVGSAIRFVINTDGNLSLGHGSSPTAGADIAAADTSRASIRIRQGTAPTTPNNGDIWFDGSNLKIRIGGTTYNFDRTAE